MTTQEQPTTDATTTAGSTGASAPGAPAGGPAPTPAAGAVGRIPVTDVQPVVDGGRYPTKAVVGEQVPVTATVFREGHDAVAATAVLVRPDGTDGPSARMTLTNAGTDAHAATLVPDALGDWGLRVDGWSDPYGTWDHDATIKVGAGVDTALMLEEGARLLERAAALPGRGEAGAEVLRAAANRLRDTSLADL